MVRAWLYRYTMDIRIIAETNEYIILDKPAGLLVHPTGKGETNTLAQWITDKYQELVTVGEDPARPGMMHRLDKEASGTMVIAKTQTMYEHLKFQFQSRTIEKEYIVLVHGKIAADEGIIDFPIDRGTEGRMAARPKTRLRLATADKMQEGKEAVTEFLTDRRFARFTLLRVKIHTGRTHQIRVHMLAYGHPVVGDTVYYNKKLNLKRDYVLGRLFLHAAKLCFVDIAGERVCYESPLPDALQNFLNDLR